MTNYPLLQCSPAEEIADGSSCCSTCSRCLQKISNARSMSESCGRVAVPALVGTNQTLLLQPLPLPQHHSRLLVATLPSCLVSLSILSLHGKARLADCWHPFFNKVLPGVLTQNALPRCNGRLGSCSYLLLCGHAKGGSRGSRTSSCCNCLHSRCARSTATVGKCCGTTPGCYLHRNGAGHTHIQEPPAPAARTSGWLHWSGWMQATVHPAGCPAS